MADSFGARARLAVGGRDHEIFRLDVVEDLERLPYSVKVLLENLLRQEADGAVPGEQVEAVATWEPTDEARSEIGFAPSRVVLQDFTGVPAVVDLAAMRDAMAQLGGDPGVIDPLVPVDLVIDHSIIAEVFGTPDAFQRNADIEFERNRERYALLRWAQQAFDSFRVVPPNTGSSTRSTSSTCRRSSRRARVGRSRTRWWGPTRTPRWSTAWGSWGGVSGGSRPRRRCWASRSPC